MRKIVCVLISIYVVIYIVIYIVVSRENSQINYWSSSYTGAHIRAVQKLLKA